MNDIVKSANPALALIQASVGNAVATARTATATGAMYGSFSGKTGVYAFGEAQIAPVAGDRFAINPGLCKHGWVAFAGMGIRPEEAMVPMSEPMPDPDSLDHPGGDFKPWQRQLMVPLLGVAGSLTGFTIELKGSAMGYLENSGKLLQRVHQRLEEGEMEFVCPVVELGEEHYKRRADGGLVYKPTFTVVDWISIDGLSASGAETGEPEAGPAPAPAPEAPAAAAQDANPPKRPQRPAARA
jgi:hypothetical protein